MKTLRIYQTFLAIGCALIPACGAQTSTVTEVYGPVPALQVYNSLGSNMSPNDEQEYKAAQAAHITWGRFDCSWQIVEKQQLPGNTSGGYTLPPPCASGLAYSRTYGVHPMMNALYGAPYNKVATAVTVGDSPVGSTQVSLRLTSGSMSSVVGGQTYLKVGTGNVSSKHAYAGTLITGKSNDSVTLASALSTDVPAGTTVVLNLQLYAPVQVPPGGNYLTNPSVQAYGRYVHFLQTQIAASGISGRVSIWNEPPWQGDPWDEAANLYDSPPLQSRIKNQFGVELAYYASTLPPVPGAMLDNGYTNKSGNGSLFVPERRSLLPAGDNVHSTFASESFHPYGNNPEDDAWLPSCVQSHNTASMYGQAMKDCTAPGMVMGGNTKWQAAFNAPANGFRGLDLGITETGMCRCTKPSPSESQFSRFELRQFLIFSGSGVHPILFYRLGRDQGFAWLHTDYTPYPVYTAFQNLMADIGTIARPAVAAMTACTIPRIESYQGTYPLAATMIVGARAGDHANSVLMYTWQRSYTTGIWILLASPSEGSVSVAVPNGLKVMGVRDTVTSSEVHFKVSGGQLSYPVADNPIEVTLTPMSPQTAPPSCM